MKSDRVQVSAWGLRLCSTPLPALHDTVNPCSQVRRPNVCGIRAFFGNIENGVVFISAGVSAMATSHWVGLERLASLQDNFSRNYLYGLIAQECLIRSREPISRSI
jgi:hypothetical protein